MKNKIAISGSHSTWKTTLLDSLDNSWYTRINEVARNIIESTWILPQNMNKKEIWEFQKLLFQKQIEAEKGIEKFISDRSVIDILAYTKLGASEEVFNILKLETEKYLETEPYDLIGYTPIEFPMQNDWIRFEWEKFRKEVDKTIVEFMEEFWVNYKILSWIPEERIKTLINNIKKI